MIALCSDGLSSGAVLSEIKLRLRDARSALIVVTADNEYKADNYHVPRCKNELKKLGLSADIFDIDTDNIDEMSEYDVVEFIGGNPFYLLHSIREHNAEPVIRQIAERKILIGWSAAAFVFGPALALVNEYSPEMNIVGINDLRALELTTVEVLPHYGRFIERFEQFEERCKAYELRNHTKVIRLNDGDAVIIDRNETKLIIGGIKEDNYEQSTEHL